MNLDELKFLNIIPAIPHLVFLQTHEDRKILAENLPICPIYVVQISKLDTDNLDVYMRPKQLK